MGLCLGMKSTLLEFLKQCSLKGVFAKPGIIVVTFFSNTVLACRSFLAWFVVCEEKLKLLQSSSALIPVICPIDAIVQFYTPRRLNIFVLGHVRGLILAGAFLCRFVGVVGFVSAFACTYCPAQTVQYTTRTTVVLGRLSVLALIVAICPVFGDFAKMPVTPVLQGILLVIQKFRISIEYQFVRD